MADTGPQAPVIPAPPPPPQALHQPTLQVQQGQEVII